VKKIVTGIEWFCKNVMEFLCVYVHNTHTYTYICNMHRYII